MSYTINSKNIFKILLVGGLALVGLFYYSSGLAQNATTTSSPNPTSPIISGFSPSQGTVNNSISILGTDLSGATNVEFYSSGGVFVASLPTVSPSAASPTFNITQVFAANVAPGTYQVGVVTGSCPGGCHSNRLPFTLIASAPAPVATPVVGDLKIEPALDEDSKNRIVIAGTQAVLAKFKFSAIDGDVDVKKIILAVADNNVDEVLNLSIYDGTTAIALDGAIIGTGSNAGRAIFDGISFRLAKGTSRVITVRGNLNTIANGADSGTSFSVFIDNVSYETGGSLKSKSFLDGLYYPEKVIYKTKPTITVLDTSTGVNNGLTPVIRFKVEADPAGEVSFKSISLRVAVSGASISAVDTSNINLVVKDSNGINIPLANAISAVSPNGTGQSYITGGRVGFITAYFTQEEVVAAGQSKEYEVSLKFTHLATSPGASVSTRLNLAETSLVGGKTFAVVAGAADDGDPSFIWSDNSAVAHSELSSDWANGVYVDGLPSGISSHILSVEKLNISSFSPVSGPRGTKVTITAPGFGNKGSRFYVYIGSIYVASGFAPDDNTLYFNIPENIENKDYGCTRENPSSMKDSVSGAANLLLAKKRSTSPPPKPGNPPVPTAAPGTVGAPPSTLRCSNIYIRTADGIQSDPKKDLVSFVVTPGNATPQTPPPPATPHISSITTNPLPDGGAEVVLESKDFTAGETNSVYFGGQMMLQNKASIGDKITFTIPNELRKGQKVAFTLHECRMGVSVSSANKSNFLAKFSSYFKNFFGKFSIKSGEKVSLTCDRVYFVNGNGVKSDAVALKTTITTLDN